MAFIEMIDYEQSEGRLREIYDELIAKRGKLAKVHQSQSLHPESIVKHMDLYLEIMFGQSPLKRYQREMLAVVVSKANDCEYCQVHHGAALRHFWKDEPKVAQLRADYRQVALSEADRKLCDYAWALTEDPGQFQDDRLIAGLKAAGLNDRAILDATLVVAYFNFVNRLVMGLGVHLEEDGGKGYRYD